MTHSEGRTNVCVCVYWALQYLLRDNYVDLQWGTYSIQLIWVPFYDSNRSILEVKCVFANTFTNTYTNGLEFLHTFFKTALGNVYVCYFTFFMTDLCPWYLNDHCIDLIIITFLYISFRLRVQKLWDCLYFLDIETSAIHAGVVPRQSDQL